MIKVVLDSNIFDRLEDDEKAKKKIRKMVDAGDLQILVPDTLMRELKHESSPFRDEFLEIDVNHTPDSVFVLDHSRLDFTRLGDGHAYSMHKGQSKKVGDAVLVDTAITDAQLFVSEDVRARKRAKEIGYECFACEYEEFRKDVLKLNRE